MYDLVVELLRSRRTRVLLPIATFISSISIPVLLSKGASLETIDYMVWCVTLLVVADFYSLHMTCKLALNKLSTAWVSLTLLSLILGVRLATVIYSVAVKPWLLPALVGSSIMDERCLKVALAIPSAALVYSFVSLLHIVKGPLQWGDVEAIPYFTRLRVIGYHIKNISRFVLKYPAILAALTVFTIRFIPEIVYWNTLIGYDTREYVAHLLDFRESPKLLTSYWWLGVLYNLPPLFTWVCGLLSYVVDPYLIMKLFEPLVLALSAYLLYNICVKKLKVGDWRIAFLATILGLLNPYVLGASQQWHRHMLGCLTTLFYIYVASINIVYEVIALMLMSLSYQLTAVLALVISIYNLLTASNRRRLIAYVFTLMFSLFWLMFYIQPRIAHIPVEKVVTELRVPEFSRYSVPLRAHIMRWIVLTAALLTLAYPVLRRAHRSYKLVVLASIFFLVTPFVMTRLFSLPYRWGPLVTMLLVPAAVIGSARLGKGSLGLFTATVFLLIALYLTPYTCSYVRLWSQTAYHLYPEPLQPPYKRDVLTECIALRSMFASNATLFKKLHIYAPLYIYPCIHEALRNPYNLHYTRYDPTLSTVLSIAKHSTKFVVVTRVKLEKEIKGLREACQERQSEMCEMLDRIKLSLLRKGYYKVYLVEIMPLNHKG